MMWMQKSQPVPRARKRLKSFRDLLFNHLYIPGRRRDVVREFHKIYYDASVFGKTWSGTYWMGVQTWKLPLDLWIYQEILFDTRPDLIVETGTAYGGSAYYLACICEHLKTGRIISIDVQFQENRPQHSRIEYLEGSSTAEDVFTRIKQSIRPGENIMVILDSDHRKEHVLKELQMYSSLVSSNCYLIVEDTNMNGHPVYPEWGPGPMEALDEFLQGNKDFEIDPQREKFILTFNPRGYLRKR
jgi:cephalosporin hydroxylase